MKRNLTAKVVYLVSIIAALALSSAAFGQVKAPKVPVSAKKAEAIALKKYPGKMTGKTALENEEGKWQYGVLVKSGKTLREVMVNAKTGKIDTVEVTTEAKERSESKADAAKAAKAKHKS